MSSEVELKQQYLRQQILENNYDPDEFADYCIEMIGNVDIDYWTFEDLERIVNSFIASKQSAHHSTRASFSNTQQDMTPTTQEIHRQPQPVMTPTIDVNMPIVYQPAPLFKQQDLDKLFSATFSTGHSKNHGAPAFSQWGAGTTTKASPKTDSLKFDEIFSGIQGPSAKPNPVQSKPPPQTYSPPSVNMNIFDMCLDSNEQNPPKGQLSSKGFEEAVLKKTKQESHSTRPAKAQQKHIQRKQSKIEVIHCYKAGLRQLLNKQNIEIQIKGHEIVNRNFFVPDYVLYHVFTKGLQAEVKRKYDHFQRLRVILAKFYPCCRLPYLEKNTWLSQTDFENIKKQKGMLQCFMNDLLMNAELRNSRILQDFLTITEHTKLKTVLTEYEQMIKLKGIQELCILSGEVKVSFGDHNKTFFDRVNPYIGELQQNMNKFIKLCDQAFLNYGNLLCTLNSITQLITSMKGATKIVREQLPHADFSDLEQSFSSISNIYSELCENVKFDMKIINNTVKPLFRFERQNLTTINEINDIRVKLTDIFIKSGGDSKTEGYAGNKGIELYKCGIDQPSKNSTVLKYQMGFYNKVAIDQTNKMLRDLSYKLDVKFGSIAHQYRERFTQQLLFWHEVIPIECQPA